MNPHYHPYGIKMEPYGVKVEPPYGVKVELNSPHPPSPDNNNYHPRHPGGPSGPHGMLPTNGHAIGSIGIPNGPSSGHNIHPAYGGTGGVSGTPIPEGALLYPNHHLHHHHHHHHHHQNSSANNNNNNDNTSSNNNNNNNNNNNTVKTCAGCGGKIVERFYLQALDRLWHNGCLKCNHCSAMLADLGSSCFTRGGMILCKMDYMRMFGSSGPCTACGQNIPAGEYVMRSSGGNNPQSPGTSPIFHVECFVCSKCQRKLSPGDRYYMYANQLVCEQDWHKMLKTSTATPTVRKGKVGRPRRSRD